MDKVRISNVSTKRMALASALVCMLLAGIGITNVDAAASKVTITSDKSSENIMTEDGSGNNYAVITLTLTNAETAFRTMVVTLYPSWSSGETWTTEFTDTSFDELEDNTVSITRASGGTSGSTTVKVTVFCEENCEAGDKNTLTIMGKSDPLWYNGGTSSGSDGSGEDSTPPGAGSNITNEVEIEFTARTGFASEVTCDSSSSTTETNEVFQGNSYLWGYTLENTGWNKDTYQFTSDVTSNSGFEIGFWTVSPGIADGKELTGQSDSSSTAVHSAAGSISITPADDARPGVYNIELKITSTNEAPLSGCNFDVVVPEPDLEITDDDITFSHTGAWINTRGDSQRVTITATVRNNGGFADATGKTAVNVEVKFYVDGSQLGSVQTIPSLAYGEETTVSMQWNPARAHDEATEVGILIKVVVDPSDTIEETDSSNNEGSTHFKVVRTKASNPSFYLGFLALTAAVGVAALLSSYYRNKDLED